MDGSAEKAVKAGHKVAAEAEADGALVTVTGPSVETSIGGGSTDIVGNKKEDGFDAGLVSLHFPAAPAAFGPRLSKNSESCILHLLGGEVADSGGTLNSGHDAVASDGEEDYDGLDDVSAAAAVAARRTPHVSLPLLLSDHWKIQLQAAAEAMASGGICPAPPQEEHLSDGDPSTKTTKGPGPCRRVGPVTGRLVLASVDDGSNGTLPTGCGSGDYSEALAALAASKDDSDEYEDVEEELVGAYSGAIVIVVRGGCTFVQKGIAMQVRKQVGQCKQPLYLHFYTSIFALLCFDAAARLLCPGVNSPDDVP